MFRDYRHRCSGLADLFTEPKLKKDKDSGELSETAKSSLSNVFISKMYGRHREVKSDYLEKGTYNEEEAFNLVISHPTFEKDFIMEGTTMQDDFIKGTNDLHSTDFVIDTKCSFDIFTFHRSKISKDYLYQLYGYARLLGYEKAYLVYCLLNTPQHIIDKYEKRIYYEYENDIVLLNQKVEQLYKNSIFDDIPITERIKIMPIDFTDFDEFNSLLPSKVEKARQYLNTLSL